MTSSNDEWWQDGDESIDEMGDDGGSERVFLKAGDEYLFIFVDGDGDEDKKMFDRPYGAPFLIREYQVPTRAGSKVSWRTWITSVAGRRDKDGTPLVDHVNERTKGGLRASHVAFFSGWLIPADVDLKELLDNKEPLPSGWKKLLPVKKRVAKLLKRIADKKQGFRGLVVSLARESKEDANSGSPIYEDRLSEDEMKILFPEEEDRTPFEYTKVLAPKTKEEIDAILDRWEPQEDDRKDDEKGGRGRRGGRDRGGSREDDDGDRGGGGDREERRGGAGGGAGGASRGGARGGGGARRPRDDNDQEKSVSSRRRGEGGPQEDSPGDSLPF
jgi:hypothetical protein